ncbi:MAG: LysM peptidoglycan-binding domain-containing protein [Actinomycetota bacterium]|nr:LysM peptidoglycan-binding domain-containing protein [Actinomycetota bacterium]
MEKAFRVSLAAASGAVAVGGLIGSAAGPAAASADRSGLTSYAVRTGDTLAALAAHVDATVMGLSETNHVASSVGGLPAVPSGTRQALPNTNTNTNTYTVRLGDTLGVLAERFGTTVSALAQTNRLVDPNFIYVGEVLSIPGRVAAAPPSARPVGRSSAAAIRVVPAAPMRPAVVASRAAPPAPSVPMAVSARSTPASQSAYTVRLGDTLATVATRLGTTPAALAETNDLADPNFVYVGEVLRLSGGAASAPAIHTRSTAVRAVPTRSTQAPASSVHTFSARSASAPASSVHTFSARSALAPVVQTRSAQAPVVQTRSAPVVSTLSSSSATATSTSTARASDGAAATATRVALAQVGKPYVYGAAGPSSYDCSGLVSYAYAAAGVRLAHYTVTQYNTTSPVSGSGLSSGDLVFYNTGPGAQPGHVALYVGGGRVVSANRPGTYVQTQSLSYIGPAAGFRRVR